MVVDTHKHSQGRILVYTWILHRHTQPLPKEQRAHTHTPSTLVWPLKPREQQVESSGAFPTSSTLPLHLPVGMSSGGVNHSRSSEAPHRCFFHTQAARGFHPVHVPPPARPPCPLGLRLPPPPGPSWFLSFGNVRCGYIPDGTPHGQFSLPLHWFFMF